MKGAVSVHAHTTNGNVIWQLAHLGATARREGRSYGETTNGSLLLAVLQTCRPNLDARCLNGNFLELPLALESSLHPRENTWKVGQGEAPIHLRTVNGGIRVWCCGHGLGFAASKLAEANFLGERFMNKGIWTIAGGTAALLALH